MWGPKRHTNLRKVVTRNDLSVIYVIVLYNNACILCLCFVNKQLVIKSFFHIEEIVEINKRIKFIYPPVTNTFSSR